MNAPLKTASSLEPAKGGLACDYVISPQDFQHIVKALFEDSGICLPESKTAFVQARLSKRLRTLGLRSFREYCALISQKEGASERQKMIVSLTTNITRFFREPHHLDHLRAHILPPLVESARKGGRVRIWSAGCSTGQEPYSIALTILSLLPEAPTLDVRILATDIDTEVLSVGEKGFYTHKEIENIPPSSRKRWFEKLSVEKEDEPAWKVSEGLRSLIAFRELNLNGSWPMRGGFHAIFCRNVVIYFDEATQMRLWSRFLPFLPPGGVLYLGHSESLSGEAAQFFICEGMTTYRRKALGKAGTAESSHPISQNFSKFFYDTP